MQIFMDKNILDFIRYETVWYAVGHLMRRLTEELDGSYAKDCGRRDCI